MGRMDDVINVSGLKVFPIEVEETMLRLECKRQLYIGETSCDGRNS